MNQSIDRSIDQTNKQTNKQHQQQQQRQQQQQQQHLHHHHHHQQLPSFIYGNGSSYTLSQGNLAIGWQFGPLLENAPDDPEGIGATGQLRRFVLGPSLSYANTQYNNVVSDSTTYGASSAPVNNLVTANIGLEYRIQPYWTVYGTYSYQRNVSTIPANTYYDNRFSLGTAFKF